MEDKLVLDISIGDLSKLIKDAVLNKVSSVMEKNKNELEKSIEKYFAGEKGIFTKAKETEFEQSLDWAVEHCFREGIKKALDELKFSDIVAEKTKEILSDDNFITELAKEKVRKAMNL